MKWKMQASAGSARLFKTWKQSPGLFFILAYLSTTPQASFFGVCFFFHWKHLTTYDQDSLKFRKEWTVLLSQPRKQSVHMSTSYATHHCCWEHLKNKNHSPRNRAPSSCLFLKLGCMGGKNWLPCSFSATLLPAQTILWPQVLSACLSGQQMETHLICTVGTECTAREAGTPGTARVTPKSLKCPAAQLNRVLHGNTPLWFFIDEGSWWSYLITRESKEVKSD